MLYVSERRIPQTRELRTLERIHDKPVWSVVRFFVVRFFRQEGISTKLLEAAVGHAAEQGAKIIEGYPSRSSGKQHDTTVYTGLASVFQKAGFVDFGSVSKTGTTMRCELNTWEPKTLKVSTA